MGSRIVNDHRSGSWQFAARELVLDGALTMIGLSTEPLFTDLRVEKFWVGEQF
jgi:hypothetical protein